MNVTFETVICAWDEKIPALLIQLVNTLLFCRTEEELRQSIDKFLVQPAHFQRECTVHPKSAIHCRILTL